MNSVPTVYTAGHSNRELPELLELLAEAGIRTVADVRRFPRSKRHPWFNSESLSDALAEAGIGYQHFGELGGMRDAPSKELLPLVSALPEPWPAYAAHARSDEFSLALAKLLKAAELRHPLVVLCAEKTPEDCHRRLLADAALLAGWSVVHLIAPGESRPHQIHPLADLVGGRLSYQPRQTSLFD